MPPFKVYKVMQDINQQLYENKSTPEGFIPVYGVVITVPTGVYTCLLYTSDAADD